MRKAERLRTNPDQPLKLLISGAPGIGKTSLVNMIARTLASHPAAIEEAEKQKLELTAISGEDLQAMVRRLYAMDPAIHDKARAALGYSK